MIPGFDCVQTYWGIFLTTDAQPKKGLLKISFMKAEKKEEELEFFPHPLCASSIGFDISQIYAQRPATAVLRLIGTDI